MGDDADGTPGDPVGGDDPRPTDPAGPDENDDTDPPPDIDPGPGTELLDAACLDGRVEARLPDGDADLTAAMRAFDPGDPLAFVLDALDARYPDGATLVLGGVAAARTRTCFEQHTSAGDRTSPAALFPRLSLVVHECGHAHDMALGDGDERFYQVSDAHEVTCEGGSYRDLPARSRILGDGLDEARPPCTDGVGYGCDPYALLYLSGDPDDDVFQSGDQGLDMLLEEAVQYAHGLATELAFADQLPAGARVSARDGVLAQLWYLQRYVRWTRLHAPEAHAAILGSPCWREAILAVWGRSWRLLDATGDRPELGLADGILEDLVRTPELLDEIARVRRADGC